MPGLSNNLLLLAMICRRERSLSQELRHIALLYPWSLRGHGWRVRRRALLHCLGACWTLDKSLVPPHDTALHWITGANNIEMLAFTGVQLLRNFTRAPRSFGGDASRYVQTALCPCPGHPSRSPSASCKADT